jgi:hypothetical protein
MTQHVDDSARALDDVDVHASVRAHRPHVQPEVLGRDTRRRCTRACGLGERNLSTGRGDKGETVRRMDEEAGWTMSTRTHTPHNSASAQPDKPT